MESKANYTVVGIAVVLMISALIVVGLWLSVGFDRKTYHYYTVYMQESVAGLNEDSLVRYNGVKVGLVSQIYLDRIDPQKVKLILKIEDGTPIFSSTKATLITQGITGNNYLGLATSSPDMTPLKTPAGEDYPVIPYESSFLNQLQNTITEVSASMKQFMSPENIKNLKHSLKNLQKITAVFANNDKAINNTLQEMPKLAKELKRSIGYFSAMSTEISAAGKQLNVTMQSGKDAIDSISQQAIPPAVSLLHRLDVIAANLEQVSADMRRNPSIIIRGTTPPKKGPGE